MPAWPDAWLIDGPDWAIALLGILTEERKLRGIEHACIDSHAAQGHIR